MRTSTWFTGWRWRVRALVYGAGLALELATWFGLWFGRTEPVGLAGATPGRLFAEGGAIGLLGLTIVAALTALAWRADVTRSMSLTGWSIMALAPGVVYAVLFGTRRLDATGTVGVIAMCSLLVLLVARVVIDGQLEEAELRARGGDVLPTASLRVG